MATHSSVLAWRIPWTEKPGGLQSMGSHRIGHDWSNLAAAAAAAAIKIQRSKLTSWFFRFWFFAVHSDYWSFLFLFYSLIFIFKYIFYLEDNCFTMLCWFLPHSNMNQPREGNGTPLQYSCLENPMNGGAWWAAVHGVSEGRTWLNDFTFTFHIHALEKKMATHSSVLAWRIPGTGEPGGLPSMGSHRVGHN